METLKVKSNEVQFGDVILVNDALRRQVVPGPYGPQLPDVPHFVAIGASPRSNYDAKGALSYVDEPNFLVHQNGSMVNLYDYFGFRLVKPVEFEVIRGRGTAKVMKELKTSFEKHIPLVHVGLTLGSDPELFAVGKDGKVIPAWEFLPKKGSYFWDGFQAEFNTQSYTCIAGFTGGMHQHLREVKRLLNVKFPDATLSHLSVIPVEPTLLRRLAEKYVEFGCSPSLNAYGEVLPGPDARELPVRFAGGHIHVGTRIDPARAPFLVQALDGVLGVAAVGMAATLDEPIRRKFYGRAGEYRLPKHGLEYRVLSNYWLIAPPVLMITFELFRVALKFGFTGLYPMVWNTPQDEVRRIINEGDVDGARKSIQANLGNYRRLLSYANICAGTNREPIDQALNAFLQGVEGVKIDHDINQNWDPKYIHERMKFNYPFDPSGSLFNAGGWSWRNHVHSLKK